MIDRRSIEEVLGQPDLIVAAINKGVRRAVREHKLLGLPMVGWRDGEVVWIPPEELPDFDEGEQEQETAPPSDD